MKQTQGILKTFPGDNFEIIPTYNGKQVTLGLLIKIDRSQKKTRYDEFEVIRPVLVNIDSFFGFTVDSLTGEKYNAFQYKFSDVEDPHVKVNNFSLDLTKGVLNLPDNIGVIDYTGYYRMQLYNDVLSYLDKNGLERTPENIYRTASRLKIEKIRSLIEEQQQKDKGESRKKTEE